jgi:hypothetical protein
MVENLRVVLGLVFNSKIDRTSFSSNFKIGPISWSVTLYTAKKVCQGQTHRLIGPIHKLLRKLSIVNTTPRLNSVKL